MCVKIVMPHQYKHGFQSHALTKYGRLSAGAEVVVGKIEEGAQLLGEERDKCLMIFLPDQTV